MIEGCNITGTTIDFTKDTIEWLTILPQTKLQADHEHYFENEIINTNKTFTHRRLTIFPDGGVSRMRLWGTPLLPPNGGTINTLLT